MRQYIAGDIVMKSFKAAELLMKECIVPFRLTKSKHCGITIKPSQTPSIT
jgi:SUMO ligase MMS21 Smc5/6 complex component